MHWSRRGLLVCGSALASVPFTRSGRAANFDFAGLRDAAPGETITLPAEEFLSDVEIEAYGTPAQPITIRAPEPFATRFAAPVSVSGRHVRIEGLSFSADLSLLGDGHTVADTYHSGGRGRAHAVTVARGIGNRVEHVLIERWSGAGIAVTGRTRKTTITGCLLRDSMGRPENAKEALRLGLGRGDVERALRIKVERCRIAGWDLDDEVISVKSVGNLLRQVTVERCDGRVQNRYGQKNRFEGLWVRDALNLRVQDQGNKVLGCVVEQSRAGGLIVAAGNVAPGDINLGKKAGHPFAADTLVSGCRADATIIGHGYRGHNLPAVRTVLREHEGPVSLRNEEDSIVEPETAGDETYAEAVFLTDEDVGPRI